MQRIAFAKLPRTYNFRKMGTVMGKIGVETPRYEVLARTPEFEIREYDPAIIAAVTTSEDNNNGAGFRILADYIGALGTPKNSDPNSECPQKIAMTAPVITHNAEVPEKITGTAEQQRGEEDNVTGKKFVTMQFILPSKYSSMETVPRPSDSRVVIREIGRTKYGVVQFSGVARDDVVHNMVNKLRHDLEAKGYIVTGDYLLARYNPPWTLPIFRTNEVLLPVA